MRHRLREEITGGLALLVVVISAGMGLWWNFQVSIRGALPYRLATKESIPRLEAGAPVYLRGILVGRVQAVQFDSVDPRIINVSINVAPGTPIFKGTYGEIASKGLTSTTHVVELHNDSDSRERLLTSMEHPTALPIIPPPANPIVVQSKRLIQEAAMVRQQAKRMLSDENKAKLLEMQGNVHELTARVDAMQRDFKAAARDKPLLGIEARKTRAEMDAFNRNASEMFNSFRQQAEMFNAIAGSSFRQFRRESKSVQNQVHDQILPNYKEMRDSTRNAVNGLRGLAEDIRRNPTSLVLGRPDAGPDPGEPGFVAGGVAESPGGERVTAAQ